MAAPSTSYYLTGHMAPVADEISASGLEVTGSLPTELSGRYLRNGPNPRPGEDPGHWFFGHGMIHGIRIREGRAEWYRNRWVRTGQFAGDPNGSPTACLRPGRSGSANTQVTERTPDASGRWWRPRCPYEVTPDLDTVGAVRLRGEASPPA